MIEDLSGAMDYHADMPGYIQDMADDLNGKAEHPCSFSNAFENFSIWMAFNQSAIKGGQVALPLVDGMDEVEEFKTVLPDAPVLPSFPSDETNAEFGL